MCQFRLVHALVLVCLGLALIGAVVCLDQGIPRWLVYVLAVLLVLDALLHAWINLTYLEGEVRVWQQVLGLVDQVLHQDRIEATIKGTRPKPVEPQQRKGPRLRVFRPDEQSPRKGPK